jgi:DNA polymerase III gamma/tau subunit
MKHLKTFESFSNIDINEEISIKDIGQGLKSFGQKIGLLKTDEQKRQAALEFIKSHPVYNKAYENFLKEDPKKAEKYVQFRIKNPDKKYIKWDDVKKDFVASGKESDQSGLLGTKSFSESKKFRSKVNESFYNKPMTFESEDHLEFCEQVAKWSKETEQPVHWNLYADPSVSSEPYMRDIKKSEYTPHPMSSDGRKLSQGINQTMTKNSAHTVDKAKTYWNMYVKPGKQFSIVEVDGKLIGVVHSGDMIEMAFDNMDRKFDLSRAAEALGL